MPRDSWELYLRHGQHGFSLSNLRDFASRFYVDIDPRKTYKPL